MHSKDGKAVRAHLRKLRLHVLEAGASFARASKQNNEKSPVGRGKTWGLLAIFHCSLRVFSRTDGHSAVAAAAYRAGTQLTDERRGFTHRYQHRKGVVKAFILAPSGAPESLRNRSRLWNAAEAAETRKNSRVAREVILALPHELAATAREALVRDLGLWMVERYRVAVDIAVHRPVEGDGHDKRNHHAHLLFTTREVTKDGLGKKTRILDDKEQGPQEIELIRSVWETLANDALDRAGLPEGKIDRRTLEAQGVDRVPQIHIGPESKAVDEREAEDGDDDDDEKGKGDKKGGKGGNGDSKSPTPSNNQSAKDGKGREVDYKTIEADKRRGELVGDIKEINRERGTWSSVPLERQMRTIETEISKLDTRLRHIEKFERTTRLPAAIKHSIINAVKFSKALLAGRIERRRQLRLTEKEIEKRKTRHKQRYGRTYRTGIHEKIRAMRSRLDMMKETQDGYRKYQLFVISIEKALAEHPAIASTLGKAKSITNREFAIKGQLKAALIRENLPGKYVAARRDKPNPIREVIERQASKQSSKAQSAQQKTTKATRAFNQPETVKILTLQQVRANTAIKVAAIRQTIPPKFKATPYSPVAPKAKKMSMKFNSAARGTSRPFNPKLHI